MEVNLIERKLRTSSRRSLSKLGNVDRVQAIDILLRCDSVENGSLIDMWWKGELDENAYAGEEKETSLPVVMSKMKRNDSVPWTEGSALSSMTLSIITACSTSPG
jgi:hypothetical protein